MIMRNHGGDDGFSHEVLDAPPSAISEVDAPATDWRFLPRQTGRHLRIDSTHVESIKARRHTGVDELQVAVSDTLFFG